MGFNDQDTAKDKTLISVVVPVFKSERLIFDLYLRLKNTLSKLQMHWEIIFVDDCSPDDVWVKLKEIRREDTNVRIIRFGRNHGQQFATLCGMAEARGSYIITIDDDLQCQPEDIPLFINKLKEGSHAVIGKIAAGKKQHHLWRNLSSEIYGSMLTKILRKPRYLSLSSFRGFSRSAVDIIIAYKGAHPHIAALMFKAVPLQYIDNVPIQHCKRSDGQTSSYNFGKLVKTASYILINHSYVPLRIMVIWGALVSVLSIFFAGWVALRSLIFGSSVAGWTSLATLISFLSGNVLLALGVLGEYIGRLVEEDSNYQQFAIFEREG